MTSSVGSLSCANLRLEMEKLDKFWVEANPIFFPLCWAVKGPWRKSSLSWNSKFRVLKCHLDARKWKTRPILGRTQSNHIFCPFHFISCFHGTLMIVSFEKTNKNAWVVQTCNSRSFKCISFLMYLIFALKFYNFWCLLCIQRGPGGPNGRTAASHAFL